MFSFRFWTVVLILCTEVVTQHKSIHISFFMWKILILCPFFWAGLDVAGLISVANSGTSHLLWCIKQANGEITVICDRRTDKTGELRAKSFCPRWLPEFKPCHLLTPCVTSSAMLLLSYKEPKRLVATSDYLNHISLSATLQLSKSLSTYFF